MDIMEFLKTRRTYRRFEQKPVEPAIAREIMEAARIASCGANRQTLKYVLVQSPEMVAKMQPLVHWAAYLPPEQGQPKPDETPVLFVAVCQDESLPGCNDTDTGLALANMTDAAWAHGVGSCIMGRSTAPPSRSCWAWAKICACTAWWRSATPPIKATWLPCRTAM